MQESIKDTEILPVLSSDHSPIFFSIVSTEPASKGNTSLLLNEEFVTIIRNYIHLKIDELNYENINDDQIRWKFLNPIQDGGGGKKPPPPNGFSSVTSANVGISPKNFLTFNFNTFAGVKYQVYT